MARVWPSYCWFDLAYVCYFFYHRSKDYEFAWKVPLLLNHWIPFRILNNWPVPCNAMHSTYLQFLMNDEPFGIHIHPKSYDIPFVHIHVWFNYGDVMSRHLLIHTHITHVAGRVYNCTCASVVFVRFLVCIFLSLAVFYPSNRLIFLITFSTNVCIVV